MSGQPKGTHAPGIRLEPERLRPHYRAFLRPGRVLLTGHSHQAWPDVAREGLLRAFEVAAESIDEKWSRAFEAAERLRGAVAHRIEGCAPEQVVLGASTHELLVRLLSALPLSDRPRIVTTEGEFHSARRQLQRLEEAGLHVHREPVEPLETLAARLGTALDDRTALLLVSSVLFETAAVVPHLSVAAEAARHHGVAFLVDAYHQFTALPASIEGWGGEPVFVLGGGYKYAQWGEGCAFLRVPPQTPWRRPIVTGWFAEFATLARPTRKGTVRYGEHPKDAFAASTYDPASHFRAAAVTGFFEAHAMHPESLRVLSLRQTDHLVSRLRDALPPLRARLDTPIPHALRGPFLAVHVGTSRRAERVLRRLRDANVWVDARGPRVRLGPAPYTLTRELDTGAEALLEALAATSLDSKSGATSDPSP